MKDKWILEGINEWEQLTGKWNWYALTVIHIYLEKDDFTHGYEFVFTLLGLGFRVRYNTDKAINQFHEWDEDLVEHYKETWTALKDK